MTNATATIYMHIGEKDENGKVVVTLYITQSISGRNRIIGW